MYRYWFVYLVQTVPLPRWLTGVGLFLLIWTLFYLTYGGFDAPQDERLDGLTDVGTILFFALMNSYAITAGCYVVERQQRTLDDLREALTMESSILDRTRSRLLGGSPRLLMILAVVGLGLGLGHGIFISGGPVDFIENLSERRFVGSIAGTMLTWFVIIHVISAFVINSQTFAALGRDHAEIDLLHPHRLHPFGTIALIPALGLIGTQMFYPLLSLGGGFNAPVVLPGFLATLFSLFYLFIHPTWPLHRRLSTAKTQALQDINHHIEGWQQAEQKSMADLQTLLAHRTYLQGVSEWPFNLSTVGRWGLYLTIPPLTWILAALMENFVDSVIS